MSRRSPGYYSPGGACELPDHDFEARKVNARIMEENQRLKLEIEEKNRQLNKLREERESLPINRIESEISAFVKYAQTNLRKLGDSKVFNAREKQGLETSVKRLASANEDIKQKLTTFFDEVHNYCDILVEKVLEGDVKDKSSHLEDDSPDASRLLHNSEMEKLKVQNQLFRVQRRLDEETEENQLLKEQIRNDHLLISQLSAKVFPAAPLYDDQQFVKKEVARLGTAFDENRRELISLKMNETHLSQFMAKYSETLKPHGVMPTGDLIRDLRNVVEHVAGVANESVDNIERIATGLQIDSTDIDTIMYEIHKLQKAAFELPDVKRELNELKSQNTEMGEELQSLEQVSEANQRTNEQNMMLTGQIRKYKLQLQTIAEENGTLKQKLKTAISQNERLMAQHAENEKSISKTMKELSEARIELQVTGKKLADVNKSHQQLQTEFTQLSKNYSELSTKHDGLSRTARDHATELRMKSQGLDATTEALRSANDEIAKLRSKVEEHELERDKYQLYEHKLNSMTKENQAYVEEMNKQAIRIAELSPMKTDLMRMKEKCDQLTVSLADVTEAYNSEKQKVREMKPKVKEAKVLSQKVSDFERTIKKLNEEVGENVRLKALNEQYEATISALTSHSDNLQSQVTSLSTTQQGLMNSAQKASSLQRELMDSRTRLKQLSSRNKHLNERLTAVSGENGELLAKLEVANQKCEYLTADNERLKNAEKDLSAANAQLKLIKEQNLALTEGIRTFENHNKSLTSRVSASTEHGDELQRRLDENEQKMKLIASQMETHKSIADGLKGIDEDNKRLQSENKKLSLKVTELQTLCSSVSTQLETKKSIIENLSNQMEQIQSKMKNDKVKLVELETQTKSLQAQLETKSVIIENYEHQITTLQESNSNLAIVSKRANVVPELESRVAELEAENTTLKEKAAKVAMLTETVRSNAKLLESRSVLIDDQSKQIGVLKNSNEGLRHQLAKLEKRIKSAEEIIQQKEMEIKEQKRFNKSMSSSFNSQMQTKSSMVEDLHEENRELTMKLAELEDGHKASLTTIERENTELIAELKRSQKENRKMAALIEELNAQVDELTRKLSESQEAKKQSKKLKAMNQQLITEIEEIQASVAKEQSNRALLHQKEEIIRQLRGLVESQEASIAAYEKRQATLEKFKRKYENSNINSIVAQIEETLMALPLERNTELGGTNVIDKLQSVLDMAEQACKLFIDQTKSIERLTSLSSNQHGTIVRLSKPM